MQILALETSGFAGSVAALSAGRVLAARQLPPGSRSAQALAPAMEAVLTTAGWTPRQVELVAVTVGPGSFTGLRVGVTTAKAFAYAAGSQVLGVDTLAALAESIPPCPGRLHVALDALRKELFAAAFVHDGSNWQAASPSHLVAESDWLAKLAAGDSVAGPPLERLREQLPSSVTLAPREFWTPQATAVGQIAERLFAAGVRHDLWRLVPEYLRPSAAEEKK